jgi:hypothetical protein
MGLPFFYPAIFLDRIAGIKEEFHRGYLSFHLEEL